MPPFLLVQHPAIVHGGCTILSTQGLLSCYHFRLPCCEVILTPLLQFNYVPFRLTCINYVDRTCTFYFRGHNGSHPTPTIAFYSLEHLLHILYREGDKCKTRHVDSWNLLLFHFRILKYLKCWTVLTIPWKIQMHSRDMGVSKRSKAIKPVTSQVSLWRFGFTAKYLDIKLREKLPVSGNQVCMDIFHIENQPSHRCQ